MQTQQFSQTHSTDGVDERVSDGVWMNANTGVEKRGSPLNAGIHAHKEVSPTLTNLTTLFHVRRQ